MFDTYHRSPSSVYERREIHEHRAPTDESICLLKEMEEKTLQRVVFNKVIQTTIGEMQIVRMLHPDQLMAALNLNGKIFKATIGYTVDEVEAIQELYEKISKQITEALLIEGLKHFQFKS